MNRGTRGEADRHLESAAAALPLANPDETNTSRWFRVGLATTEAGNEGESLSALRRAKADRAKDEHRAYLLEDDRRLLSEQHFTRYEQSLAGRCVLSTASANACCGHPSSLRESGAYIEISTFRPFITISYLFEVVAKAGTPP